MKITVNGKSLNFPRACVCCGEPSETKKEVSDFQRRVNMRYTSTWSLPYCKKCVEHVDFTEMHWYDGLAIIFSAGLYLIPYFTFTRPLRRWYAKKNKLKPTCESVDVAGYQYFMIGEGKHVFDFQNQEFAKAFAAMNRAQLESNDPQIRVLLSGS